MQARACRARLLQALHQGQEHGAEWVRVRLHRLLHRLRCRERPPRFSRKLDEAVV